MRFLAELFIFTQFFLKINAFKTVALKKQYKRDDDYYNKNLHCMRCDSTGKGNGNFCSLETCDDELSKHNKSYTCVSANRTEDGKIVKVYKSCTYEGSGICDELKKKGYDSCSTCDEERCNALVCYQCDDYQEFHHSLSPCKQLKFSSCNNYDDSACFSAKMVLNGHDAIYKGCQELEDQQNLTTFLKKFGFVSHYFCQEDLCNENDTPTKLEKKITHAPATNKQREEPSVTPKPEEKVRSRSHKRVVSHFSAIAAVVIALCLCVLFR